MKIQFLKPVEQLYPCKEIKPTMEETTLYLAQTFRTHYFNQGVDRNSLYNKHFVPVIKKMLEKKIEIVGYSHLPASIDLSITDLSFPFCIFEFIVVKMTPDLMTKLTELDLHKTIVPSSKTTISENTEIFIG